MIMMRKNANATLYCEIDICIYCLILEILQEFFFLQQRIKQKNVKAKMNQELV